MVVSDEEPAKRKRKPTADPETDPRFVQFWQTHPRRVKKSAAAKAFAKIDPPPDLLAAILAAVEAWKRSADWTKNDGGFTPHASTWLHGRRWEDELPTARAAYTRPPPVVPANCLDSQSPPPSRT